MIIIIIIIIMSIIIGTIFWYTKSLLKYVGPPPSTSGCCRSGRMEWHWWQQHNGLADDVMTSVASVWGSQTTNPHNMTFTHDTHPSCCILHTPTHTLWQLTTNFWYRENIYLKCSPLVTIIKWWKFWCIKLMWKLKKMWQRLLNLNRLTHTISTALPVYRWERIVETGNEYFTENRG